MTVSHQGTIRLSFAAGTAVRGAGGTTRVSGVLQSWKSRLSPACSVKFQAMPAVDSPPTIKIGITEEDLCDNFPWAVSASVS